MDHLSSPTTVVFKFVFTGAFTVLLIAGTISSFRGDDPSERWLYMSALVFGCTYLWSIFGSLKRVRLVDDELHISNYLRQVVVPLRHVVSVRQRHWLSTTDIVVEFDRDIGFGTTVRFIPNDLSGMFGWWTDGTVVRRLRRAVDGAWERPV